MRELILLLIFIPIIGFGQTEEISNNIKRITDALNQPKIKSQNEILVIGIPPNEKKYKLQSEKLWIRWNISISKIDIDEKGVATLTYKNPLTGSTFKTKIRKTNVNKIIKGSKNNKKEIIVENLEGREFYLVRIQ